MLTGVAVGERRPGDRRGGAAAARRAAVRPSRLPHRRRGTDPAEALRSRRRRPAAARRGARRLAPRRDPRLGLRELARRRVAGPIRGRLAAIQRRLSERSRRLSLEDTWKLINAPVDEDNAELLATLALAVAGDTAQRSLLTFLLDPARLRDATLEEAEQAGRTASILRWFALQYPDVGGVTIERAAALEEAAAARVVARLRVEVDDPTIGRCRTCGKTCAPWFPLCDRCFGRR